MRKAKLAAKPKVIGYLRVSTGLQDLENPKLGILKLANEHGWKVTFIEETVSGRVSYKEREFGRVVKELKEGDVLIVSELSRLGRSMLEIMTLLCDLSEKGIRVYAIKGNHRVDNSIQSKVMTMVLCMAAEIERELISQRTKEALQRIKKEGVKLGRPKGVPGRSNLERDIPFSAMKQIYNFAPLAFERFNAYRAEISEFRCSFTAASIFVYMRNSVLLSLRIIPFHLTSYEE